MLLQGRAYGVDEYHSNVAAVSAATELPGGASWAFDPDDTGEQVPVAGRSLFDYLFTVDVDSNPEYRIPFPLQALRDYIQVRLNAEERGTAIRQVLIPHGRSLQRELAVPDYFRFPRVVLVVDGESGWRQADAGLLLKDRLYIGYQEKAGLLEVISYNEVAARFEFQIVRNYVENGEPEVLYANREICLTCHQNQAPIFSRPLWSETHANPAIARALQETGREFYDIPLTQGIDIPNAMDDATDRANLFAVTQVLWRQGCGGSAECRAHAFIQMLRHLLSGGQDRDLNDDPSFNPVFNDNWEKYWPAGMAIPNPDIGNRDPFRMVPVATRGKGVQLDTNIRPVVDPLVLRPPLEVWSRKQSARSLVTGLAAFVAETDVNRLDTYLHQTAKQQGRDTAVHSGNCELAVKRVAEQVYRISFQCSGTEGRLYLNQGRIEKGSIDRLYTDKQVPPTRNLKVVGGEIRYDGSRHRIRLDVRYGKLHARLSNGNTIDSVDLLFDDALPEVDGARKRMHGKIQVNELADFELVREAVERMLETSGGSSSAGVFSGQPFQRSVLMSSLFRELGMPALNWCCDPKRRMPEPVYAEAVEGDMSGNGNDAGYSDDEKRFFQYCSACHQGPDRFPPNFLHGNTQRVRAALNHCAPRIQVRLRMWNYPTDSASKSPMPPARAIARLYPEDGMWRNSADLRALQDYTEHLSGSGASDAFAGQPGTNYESLRECLPAALY